MKSLNVLVEWFDICVDVLIIISIFKENQIWTVIKAVSIDFIYALLQYGKENLI